MKATLLANAESTGTNKEMSQLSHGKYLVNVSWALQLLCKNLSGKSV